MPTAPPPPALEFSRVTKTYPGQPQAALQDLTLRIPRGSRTGIIGRSGAGKSTLVRLISGLETPDVGHIQVQGQPLTPATLKQLQARTGLVFQHFNLLAQRSVLHNVTLPLELRGTPKVLRERRARELLQLVGLEALADRYPAQLSGGQKQRVGIARALVTDPDLLLADEATSALDPETSAGLLTLLTELQRERDLTLILVTHQLEVIRAATTHVAVLDQGRLVEAGETASVLRQPQSAVTRALLDAHRPEHPLLTGETLHHLTLPDLGGVTLDRLARQRARILRAEAHALGVDVWLTAPDHVPAAELGRTGLGGTGLSGIETPRLIPEVSA